MTYTLLFAPEALDQLDEIEQYIAETASYTVAAHYVDAILAYCEGLQTFPHRGIRRDDIRSGLRITNYRKRAVIAFDVNDRRVSII